MQKRNAAKKSARKPKAAQPKFRIEVLVGNDWKERAVISTTPKGRVLKNENDALRYGYGIFGTRPRLGQATSKSGKKFRAVKV